MELLPCPFCGGKATFDHDDNGWNWVVCEKCGVSTDCRVSAMDDCKPLLAEAWNRRASPASAPEDVIDAVTIALRKAFQLGQTYWQQADSDYISQNKKSDDTYAKFLVLSEEISALLATAPTPPVSEDKDKIIAAANALENIASTSSSTRIRRVANDALTAIRARRNHAAPSA